MVEIRYGGQYEIADLAGQTVSEAREQFRSEFGIPDKAKAKLNGQKVKGGSELDTVLNDDDQLAFAVARSKGPFLVGALLLALAVTGGVFAFGWINASTTLCAGVATADFADVSVNDSLCVSWSPYGFFKGAFDDCGDNGTAIFNVHTGGSGYDGDLVVTVSLANGDTLAKCYRVLAMKLMMYSSTDNIIDINESNTGALGWYGDADDYTLLTLSNGEASMFPEGKANGDNMTVRVKSGFYITHVFKGASWSDPDDYQPLLFCEVAQR
jgi:molybdopterin converting factor small subunit